MSVCIMGRLVISVLALQVMLGSAMTSFGQQLPRDKKILVLGAGISGIAAAKTLHDAGYTNFEIIEGADSIGGRIKGSQLGGYTVESGALWIYGRGSNPVWLLAEKYNISTMVDNTDDWKVFDKNGMDVTETADAVYETSFGSAYDEVENMSKQTLQEDRPDFSIRAALTEEGWIPRTAIDNAIEYNTFDFEFAVSPGEISTKYAYFTATRTAHGDDEIVVVKDGRGFTQIVRGLASEFLVENDPRLHLSEIVTSIVGLEDTVTVRTTRTNYTCDYVIVTFSLGVLQHRQVSFNPPLPEWKQDAIDQFTYATLEQIYFQFPNKFWDDNLYFVYADEKRGYYNSWYNIDAVQPGSNILQLTVTEDEARRLARLSDAEIITEAKAVLQTMFNVSVPEPSGFLFNRWSTDPLFFGSYSDWSIGYEMDRYEALKAPVARIYFAGEYTTDIHYSFTHGAMYSGMETANNLLACIADPSVCINFKPPPAKVRGCTYALAKNFHTRATVDDGSCSFESVSLAYPHRAAASVVLLLLNIAIFLSAY